MTELTSLVANNDNVTLEQFAMRCARHFGALVNLCSELMEDSMPEKFEVNKHYRKDYEKAKAEYENFIANPPTYEEMEKKYNDYVAEETEYAKQENEKRRIIRERYEAMLAKVRKWQPPTNEPFGLKELMEQELTESIEMDCKEYEPHLVTRRQFILSGTHPGALKEYMEICRDDLEKATIVVDRLNKWQKDLRESLRNVEQ